MTCRCLHSSTSLRPSTVDHDTLTLRLQIFYVLDGVVINWFSSYLRGWLKHVRVSESSSPSSAVLHCVLQGSFLEPILFLLYTGGLLQLIKRHQLHSHAFADDTKIYEFCQPISADSLCRQVSTCVEEVSSWIMANRLLLNPAKIEVIWCSSPRHQYLIPTGHVHINNTSITSACSVTEVRDLGVYLDADVTMWTQVITTVRSCFAVLRQIQSIQRSLPHHAVLTIIRDLMVSKVDYCNSVLTGISDHLMDRLQSVLNDATRLIFSMRRSNNIIPLLSELHC